MKWKHFPCYWPFVRVPDEFPAQRPVMRSFDDFFDLRLNKRLCKQSWGWWFETPSCPLWHHHNGYRLTLLVELFSCELYRTFHMESSHWFISWFGTVRQQTWSNIDPDLCHHMVLPSHNELTWGWEWSCYFHWLMNNKWWIIQQAER